ncbi:Glycoside hydrolase, family 35 [Sesbania bispinosa]|nr:Glycoside hydrolase, family 35 [Sesbania bispinosa]
MASRVLMENLLKGKFFVLLLFLCVFAVTASVTYDHKAILVNGQRRILISGSIHYPRSTPQMWPDLIQKAKDGGLDVIQTYVFWNGHEPSPGKGISCLAQSEACSPILGLLNEPKWGHLRDLHKAIKLCEPALLSVDPTVTWPGNNLEVHVFKANSGACAAFLANYNTKSSATVTFGNGKYDLPPWSISILPDCKTAVFNTARLGAQSSQMRMAALNSGFAWQSYNEEPASSSEDDTITANALWEQVNVTPRFHRLFVVYDRVSVMPLTSKRLIIGMPLFLILVVFILSLSDKHLHHLSSVNIDPNEGFIKNGQSPLLTVMSAGHALHVFINGQLSGTVYGGLDFPKLTFSDNVKLRVGNNKISLLSIAVGLPDNFHSFNLMIGLKGEALNLHTVSGSTSVEWVQGSLLAKKQPLTWYKTTFSTPAGNDPLALDMSSMGKGQVWINGRSIGRHWPGYIAHGSCGDCYYAGTYTDKKCRTNCGEPSEMPTLRNQDMLNSGKVNRPKAHLWCPPGQKISQIKLQAMDCHKELVEAFEREAVMLTNHMMLLKGYPGHLISFSATLPLHAAILIIYKLS